jgi:polysaccharide biosynthesis protein PslH
VPGGARPGNAMRILLVAEDWPWPMTGGGLIRLAKVIEALSEMGEVDLFSLYDHHRDSMVLPREALTDRLEMVPYPVSPATSRWRAAWAIQRGIPMEILMRTFDPAPRQRFEAWATGRYDVAWFSTAGTYQWLGRPRRGPTIVDLMDLEDVKARQRADLVVSEDRPAALGPRLHRTAVIAQTRKNADDWQRLQQSVAAEVDRVVLCSDEDVRRSGLSNAVCIPNTYARPEQSVGHIEVGELPTILLQGSLNYAPNMDAVEWLVEEIAPKLWARVPGAEIRLVGRPTSGVELKHRPPAISVVGRVPDMEPELARADIVVVPLRIGSGTRLKILEAFAHRIPVVATTVGADGLDVRDGVHLLIADDAESFAGACQRLLEDLELRKRLVDAAEELYLQRYEWSATKARLQGLVREVAASPTVQ